jgi:hypothetical protein
MSSTGTDHQSERTPLRRESRTWGLIRRTLPLGRSMGSLFYLISVGVIAGWVVAVFFGVGLFFLMPRSAELASGLSPGATSFDASFAETPWLQQSTSRLHRLSGLLPPEPPQPLGDAVADKGRPPLAPGEPISAKVNPLPAQPEATIVRTIDEPPEPAPGLNRGQALTVELGTISAAGPEAVAMPAPQSQIFVAPKLRGGSQASRSSSSRKPLERRPSNTRRVPPHAPVNAIDDVLQKHSHLLK